MADDQWREYYKEKKRIRRYLPDPDELAERVAMLRELKELGFNREFIGSVVQHDTPTIEVVRRMVKRHGMEETWRRCQYFIEEVD